MEMFDFEDGNGSVPAHRHPFGGGWVANSAHVDETAWVWCDSRVYGHAQVLHETHIGGQAKVYGSARVRESALVCENAKVCGNADLRGKVEVSGTVLIEGSPSLWGKAKVGGDVLISGDFIYIYGSPEISGKVVILHGAEIFGQFHVSGNAVITRKCTREPVVIGGLPFSVTVMDDDIHMDGRTLKLEELQSFSGDRVTDEAISKLEMVVAALKRGRHTEAA